MIQIPTLRLLPMELKRNFYMLQLVRICVLWFCLAVSSAAAGQSANDIASETAAQQNIGKSFQTLAILGQTPGVSSTRLEGDELDIRASRLHFGQRLTKRDEADHVTISPYFEISLGRSKAGEIVTQNIGAANNFSLNLRYRAIGALVGGGFAIPLGADTSVTPMLLAGYSSLKIDSTYSGPNAPAITAAIDGILDNGRIKSSMIGGAIQVDHRSMIGSSFLTLFGRYNHFLNIDDRVSDPGLEPRGTAGVAIVSAQIELPTKLYLGERELFLGGTARGTQIVGAGRNAFGFDSFGEFGASAVFDYRAGSGIAFGVHGSLFRGSGVTGHSIGVIIRISRDRTRRLNR